MFNNMQTLLLAAAMAAISLQEEQDYAQKRNNSTRLSRAYPLAAVIGQDAIKEALLLGAVDTGPVLDFNATSTPFCHAPTYSITSIFCILEQVLVALPFLEEEVQPSQSWQEVCISCCPQLKWWMDHGATQIQTPQENGRSVVWLCFIDNIRWPWHWPDDRQGPSQNTHEKQPAITWISASISGTACHRISIHSPFASFPSQGCFGNEYTGCDTNP